MWTTKMNMAPKAAPKKTSWMIVTASVQPFCHSGGRNEYGLKAACCFTYIVNALAKGMIGTFIMLNKTRNSWKVMSFHVFHCAEPADINERHRQLFVVKVVKVIFQVCNLFLQKYSAYRLKVH